MFGLAAIGVGGAGVLDYQRSVSSPEQAVVVASGAGGFHLGDRFALKLVQRAAHWLHEAVAGLIVDLLLRLNQKALGLSRQQLFSILFELGNRLVLQGS